MLTKEQILAASDLPKKEVQVPEWGGSVFVRSLTSKERDAFDEQNAKIKEEKGEFSVENLRARLAARCIVNADGERLFADEDADALGEKSSVPVMRIYEAAAKLNAIGDQEIEDLAKN